MPQMTMSAEEFVRRGQEYYDRFLKEKLEPEHIGKFLVMDVETNDYEVDAEEMAAFDRLRGRIPNKLFYTIKIGYPAANRMGGRWTWSQG